MSSKKKEDIFKDARFSHLTGDPRFKHMPQSEQKVKIDKRFKSMFENEKFKVKYTVDKYGRQINKTSSEDLKKYYELSSEDEDDELESSDQPVVSTEGPKFDEDGNALLETDVELPMTIRDKLKNLDVDYIRGEGVLQSDSSSDEESSEDEAEELFIEHVWGELDREAERTDDSSRRIAACNMDWDRIKAVDIMVLCNSFLPPGGSILSVKIYPSDFGKTRMAEEELAGPQELTTTESKKDEDQQDEQVDEEDEAYKEKLREYQLNRLKYFYAVIECNSVQTADKMYAECDGLEYESTANRLDLRFIPDELEFDDEPKDECRELPDMSNYKPRMFFTTALQQAKVELTWDENDVDRTELTEKLFTSKSNEVADNDLRRFVACSSSSEEEPEEVLSDGGNSSDNNSGEENTKVSKIDKYKALLGEIKQKEDDKKSKQVEMEFTWGTGLNKKSDSKKAVVEEELTPFEQILEKKRLKKKSKKEERKQKFKAEAANSSDESEEQNGYSSDDVDVDMNDPYFAEEFANGEFDLPKKSKKKKKVKEVSQESDDEDARKQAELQLLLDDGEEEKAHFSLKKIQDSEDMTKSKRKRKFKKGKGQETNKTEIEDNFKMNLTDNRFAAVFSEPDFNIDPTDSHFKKTKGMEVLIHEKLKRRQPDELPRDEQVKKVKKDVSMSVLIKNVKRKIAHNK